MDGDNPYRRRRRRFIHAADTRTSKKEQTCTCLSWGLANHLANHGPCFPVALQRPTAALQQIKKRKCQLGLGLHGQVLSQHVDVLTTKCFMATAQFNIGETPHIMPSNKHTSIDTGGQKVALYLEGRGETKRFAHSIPRGGHFQAEGV